MPIRFRKHKRKFVFENNRYFFTKNDKKLEVINKEETENTIKELAEDLVAIVISFASKIYGKRSKNGNNHNKQAKN